MSNPTEAQLELEKAKNLTLELAEWLLQRPEPVKCSAVCYACGTMMRQMAHDLNYTPASFRKMLDALAETYDADFPAKQMNEALTQERPANGN